MGGGTDLQFIYKEWGFLGIDLDELGLHMKGG